jgi:hypothetical protein
MLSPEDRASLGKAGMTAEEALLKAQVKSEKDLQRLVVSLLRLRGVEPVHARMDKKTTTAVGTLDILFAVWVFDERGDHPEPCAWECKVPGEEMEPEQIKMAARLSTKPNAWNWEVITSVDQARSLLDAMGLKAAE